MNTVRMLRWPIMVMMGIAVSFFSLARADDGGSGTLADVHKILLQAAGYQSDTPPTVDQQTELLNKALGMIKTIPHVYHGQLKAATRDINAALSELASGDTAHKARTLIFDADDEVKAIL